MDGVGVGVAGARSFAPPEGEGKVHARDGQTVSLAVPHARRGAQRCVSTPLSKSSLGVVLASASSIWTAPGSITQNNQRSLEAYGRLQSTMPLWATVSG